MSPLKAPTSDQSTLYKAARLARDARFDGLFFIAVKTTGIYCRPICPATPPKEENIQYFDTAIAAAQAGYRPCLRCRPDSAPGSPAWKGVDTTLERAITLIESGELHYGSVTSLSARLGISERYLRQLFSTHIGISPKAYALHQQCLFAKKLLHETTLPITHIALSSGFKSVRRFNDCFKTHMQLTPKQLRKSGKANSKAITLKLYYRPPYNWSTMHAFLSARHIPTLEWVDEQRYGRTFEWMGCKGAFSATHLEQSHCFKVDITLERLEHLKAVIQNIKRILDVDANLIAIEQHLQQHYSPILTIQSGIRLAGTWGLFEAGIRAILGQQISVTAARNLVTTLVRELGEPYNEQRLFPSPQAIANSSLDFFKIPASRKHTLRALSQHFLEHKHPNDTKQWINIKGIGPWTIDYARMRGLSHPDIYLGTDLGIKKAAHNTTHTLAPELAAPWRSYLTYQLWHSL